MYCPLCKTTVTENMGHSCTKVHVPSPTYKGDAPEWSLTSLQAKVKELELQIAALTKNDYTGDYCAVCKLGIREKEARSESFGVWTHPLCSITSQRNAALLEIERLKEIGSAVHRTLNTACADLEAANRLNQEQQKKMLLGLWQLLRAYAGGGMPPLITKGIRLACQNVGMSEDHIASAELGGDDPDFIKQETEKRSEPVQNCAPETDGHRFNRWGVCMRCGWKEN